MNAERRKRISAIVSTLTQARTDLEEITTEERDAFDNMPEGLQQSERGQQAEEAADNLETTMDELDSVIANLEQVTG